MSPEQFTNRMQVLKEHEAPFDKEAAEFWPWKKWFAWKPISVNDKVVWFKLVERRKERYGNLYMGGYDWKYRLIVSGMSHREEVDMIAERYKWACKDQKCGHVNHEHQIPNHDPVADLTCQNCGANYTLGTVRHNLSC
jgi:hypothetical protein